MDPLRDKLEDLRLLIEQQHLVCLETEAAPGSDHRIRLENYMREYLYLAPHERKFRFPQTAEVLHRTIAFANSNFDPSWTIEAWHAIAKYADNLVVQPWRREFREIKLYCGFYKHMVEKYLIGAEKILEMMGYYRSTISPATMILQDVIDPDRVTGVSKDAILAQVEIKIMRQIHESLSARHNISWSDIISFRENHPGLPEQAIKTLNYRARERAYYEQQYRRSSLTQHQQQQQQHSYCPQPAFYSNYIYNPSCYELKPHDLYPTNGYHFHNNGYPYHTQTATCPSAAVPTGRLIELESPPQSSSTTCFTRNVPLSKAKDDGAGTWEEWDLVYKNFANQGYRKEGFKDRHYMEGHEFSRVHDDDRKSDRKNSETGNDNKKEMDCRRKEKKESSEKQESLHLSESLTKMSIENYESAESSISSKPESGSSTKKQETTKKRTEADGEDREIISRREAPSLLTEGPCTVKLPPVWDNWECITCTFLNSTEKTICEMCGKSRHRKEDKLQPCGGLECGQCTYVNKPGLKTCMMCDNPLANASTYI